MTPTLRLSKLLIALVLLITSCQKDDGIANDGNQNENIPDTFSEYFGNEISRDFLGSVIDKDHNPIEGVSISIGSETAVTDSNGVFIIRDATVKEQFGYIKAEKAGYIHGSRSVVPASGTNKVTIMLLEETVVGTVSSGSASTVTANDGSSVSFDGNFTKEDGTAYTGSVNVIMHHLDPTDEDMEDQMPGMLYAENEDGAERMLQTLGMLAVELRGSGGEDLNLAEGSTSEIKIPVDASLLASAPATIPLWYFDEVNGYWKEEGEATLQGNMYVGTVSHFSFWNWDIPIETIALCVTLVNQNNEPQDNLNIQFSTEIFGESIQVITNENGQVCGYVASNEPLTIIVSSPGPCELYSQLIGSFNEDTDFELTIPELTDTELEEVSGTFLTCGAEPVTNGYVLLNYEGETYFEAVDNGNFNITINRCSNSVDFTIQGFDVDNLQNSSEVTYNFGSAQTDIGEFMACEDYQYSYIYYQIGNNPPTSLIAGENPEHFPEQWFKCQLSPANDLKTEFDAPGTITDPTFGAYFTNFQELGIYNNPDENNDDVSPSVIVECRNLFEHIEFQQGDNLISQNFEGYAEVLSFGEVGEFVELNFLGTFDIYNSPFSEENELIEEQVQVQGFMRIRRDL